MNNPHNKFFLSLGIVGFALAVSFALVSHATSKNDITYPVGELGGCKNETECFRFCDARDNLETVKACIGFAKKHNLLSPTEIEEAENFVITRGITQGPGGCRNQKECDTYCEDTAHLNECLDFAEKYGMRSSEEIAEGRKIAALLAQGAKLPGGCREKNQCMEYCNDPSHMRECVTFAEKAGFISKEEAAEAQKILPLIERGEKTPGNCARKDACEAYCADTIHIDECLAFAEKAEILSAEDLRDAKKFAPFIKSGETPGKCTRKAECETYCSDQAHFEECVGFAERVGLISKEDVELAKKTKGVGPGGCRSPQECETFCKTAENQETCIAFAKEHGLDDIASRITEEATKEAKEKATGDAEKELDACAQKSCSEMIVCLQGVGVKTGSASGSKEEYKLPSPVQTKLDACIEEIKASATGAQDAGKAHTPPAASGPAPLPTATNPAEEATRQYEEEYKKQYDAEYQKQYEEQVKSQVNCSLFDAAPTCDYAGAPGTQNYNLCKQCFPNK
ncbi:MAG: hypothetical protein G01um101429_980 [Parcubacteria group bacterium Gr01-1014_29]|nr:MAG: hypothetical protein G01um101429_980 [Parcubacteria group bacterium Gr01-1014_29]